MLDHAAENPQPQETIDVETTTFINTQKTALLDRVSSLLKPELFAAGGVVMGTITGMGIEDTLNHVTAGPGLYYADGLLVGFQAIATAAMVWLARKNIEHNDNK
jgi:hypothetical protein